MKNGHSKNLNSLKLIADRIAKAEARGETTDIDFTIKMKNGFIEKVEWRSEMVRVYDMKSYT